MLMTWGRNVSGQLGDNTITAKSSPVQTVAYGANWKQVSCGYDHTAAIKTDGTLWVWGRNNNGQIADNTIASKSSPVQTTAFGTNWKEVSAGYQFATSIKNDGTLWTWGVNNFGQLGDNTATKRSSPVQTVAGGTNWKSASCNNNVAAIKTDGTLWTWGYNLNGSLGDNTATNRSSPVQTVAGGTNWKQVFVGSTFTAATKTDGTLWNWGKNSYGQLGDNTSTHRSSPVQTIAGGTNWKQVSCGAAHTAAVKTDGTLWCWGYNGTGSLGDNTITNRSSPVQTIAFGTNWKQVACTYHTAAIKTDGTLWTWGSNSSGQFGDNTRTNRSSPVQTILYGTTWKQVANGYNHTAAIKDGDF
jgi:alpha-tubulin suppressor-like RCC1 family protein